MQQLPFNEMLKNLIEHYDIVKHYHLNTEEEILLDSTESTSCRFCGKQEPNVTFNSAAHTIPHSIGNRTLKSKYECDTCNQLFGKYESQFTQYMKFAHVFAQVSKGGGSKVPKFKNNSSEKSNIRVENGNFNVTCVEGEDLRCDIDKEHKKVKITGKRSYIPQDVFKAIVKMALSIMPEEEMIYFSDTLQWLQGKRTCGGKLIVIQRMYIGINPFMFDSCMIFKRKNDSMQVPAYIFGLAYYSFFIQIAIPLCQKDLSKQGANMTMPYIPTPLDEKKVHCSIECHDLTSTKKVINEDIVMTLSFSDMEELDLQQS